MQKRPGHAQDELLVEMSVAGLLHFLVSMRFMFRAVRVDGRALKGVGALAFALT